MKVVFTLMCSTLNNDECGGREIVAARNIFSSGVDPDKVDEAAGQQKLASHLEKLPDRINELNNYLKMHHPADHGKKPSFEKINHYVMTEVKDKPNGDKEKVIVGRDVFTGIANINDNLLPPIVINNLKVRNLEDDRMEIPHMFIRFFQYCRAIEEGLSLQDDPPLDEHFPWITWTVMPVADANEEKDFGIVGMAGSGKC